MLRAERHRHGGILRALAFVDRSRVGQGEFIEFANRIQHDASVKIDMHHTFFQVNLRDAPDIAIEHDLEG